MSILTIYVPEWKTDFLKLYAVRERYQQRDWKQLNHSG